MLAAALFICLMVPGIAFLFWIVIGYIRGKADEPKPQDKSDER